MTFEEGEVVEFARDPRPTLVWERGTYRKYDSKSGWHHVYGSMHEPFFVPDRRIRKAATK